MVRESENVRVVVRVRPLTEREERKGEGDAVVCVGDGSIQVVDRSAKGRTMTGTAFQFNKCFGPECSQEQLFKHFGVLPLLDHVLEGYSATVFAYGPTGCGKTYTITGRPDSILKYGSGDSSDGIVIRSVEALFDKIQEMQRDGLQFKVRSSCVEIYNENVIDLFKMSRGTADKNYLPVKFDTARGSFFVGDLSYGKCNAVEDLLRLYMKALRNRSVASHELNRDSSRSHCVLTVYVDSMVAAENGHISTRHGKISFVDLAGSERLKDSHSQGSTLRETGSINKSIFTLGKVISSLCDRKKTKIPYRDSKLTQLLMDSIGGTSMTIMLACVSPAASHLNETMRTLNYASGAKNIKNKPVVLLDPQQTMVSELKKEIEQLRAENQALRDALLGHSLQGSFQKEGSRSSSAPDHSLAEKLNYPSENLRHSISGMRQHDVSHNKSSDSILSFPDSDGRLGRGGGNEHSRSNNSMPSVAQRRSPDKNKGSGIGSSDYGRVRPQDSLSHRRSELQPAHFQMPQIQVSGRSAQEIHAEETRLMRELESTATFSYFNQKTNTDNSPTNYHQAIRKSGSVEDREKALARQRMKTSERKLREEILQLPEAQEYFPHHQRRVMDPSDRPRSKSAMDNVTGPGASKKKQKSPISERAGLRELEKLSKYSYFSDEALKPNAKAPPQVPHIPHGSNGFSQGMPNDENSVHRNSFMAAERGDPHMVGNRVGYMPRDRSPSVLQSNHSAQYNQQGSHASSSAAFHRGPEGYTSHVGGASAPFYAQGQGVGATSAPFYAQGQGSSNYASSTYAHERERLKEREREIEREIGRGISGSSGAGGGLNGHSRNYSSSEYGTDEKSGVGGGASPRSIRAGGQRGSPKSIRSSAAENIQKSASLNGHRPSSAERERLLDEAFEDIIGSKGVINNSHVSARSLAEDDWMTKLNPLLGIDLDKAAGGHWQHEFAKSTVDKQISERPRSANRPPSVPRNYLHKQQQAHQQPQHAQLDVRSSAPAYDAKERYVSENDARHADGQGASRSPNKLKGGGSGEAREAGSSTYEELMRNLEQSRLKAQQARMSLMEKREQWKNDV